jgi:hypothetical protein
MRQLIPILPLAVALVAAPVFSAPALHAEDKKKEEHKHEHADEKQLGEITLNGVTFTVALAGHVKAGEEVEIILKPKGAAPKGTVRGWIGIESAKGSAKGKAHDHDGELCIHAEVPETIPAEAKVWVELDADGGKAKAGLGLPRH